MIKNTYTGEGGNIKFFYIIIISVGFLLVAAFMAAILYSANIGKDHKKIPVEKNFAGPQEIIDYSIENTLNQKTYSIGGNLGFDMRIKSTDAPTPSFLNFMPDYRVIYDINFKENIDQSDPENEKSSANVELDIDMSSEGGSEDYNASFDAMLFGKDFAYFRLNDFDFGMMGIMLGAQVKEYKGKWYELDLAKMRSEGKGDFSFEKYSSAEIKKVLDQYKIIRFAGNIGDDKINGADAYHYKAKIDTQAVIDYCKALLKMRDSEAKGRDLKKITSETSNEFNEFSNKYYDLINKTLEKIDIEIWIGKKDNLIHKIILSGDYDKKFIETVLMRAAAEERVKSELRSKDLSIKYYIEREKENFDRYYIINKSYEGYKKMSSWDNSYSDSINYNLNNDSYVIWSSLESTTDLWCMDSMGREGYVPLDFSKLNCLEISDEPRGEPKDISKLVDEEMEHMKVEMDFLFKTELIFNEFNIPVNIQKPENAEDMTKMFE